MLCLFYRYLSRNDLCKRSNPQTFMEERDWRNVLSICKDRGRQLHPGRSNLCISDSLIWVYQVYKGWGCKVVHLKTYPQHVIVACDKIGNQCLPVHYQRYKGQKPRATNRVCSPLRSSRVGQRWTPFVWLILLSYLAKWRCFAYIINIGMWFCSLSLPQYLTNMRLAWFFFF